VPCVARSRSTSKPRTDPAPATAQPIVGSHGRRAATRRRPRRAASAPAKAGAGRRASRTRFRGGRSVSSSTRRAARTSPAPRRRRARVARSARSRSPSSRPCRARKAGSPAQARSCTAIRARARAIRSAPVSRGPVWSCWTSVGWSRKAAGPQDPCHRRQLLEGRDVLRAAELRADPLLADQHRADVDDRPAQRRPREIAPMHPDRGVPRPVREQVRDADCRCHLVREGGGSTEPARKATLPLDAVDRGRPEVAKAARELRTGGEQSALQGELARQPAIVPIEERHQRPARHPPSGVPRRPGAAVRERQVPKRRPEARDQARRAVGRAVVGADHLVARLELGEQRADRARQQMGPIVAREDDAHRLAQGRSPADPRTEDLSATEGKNARFESSADRSPLR